MGLKPHKFAELLPMMSDSEFSALKADIDANGQRDDVILFEGKILDGRNRNRALEELGKKVKTSVFRGGEADALAFVYSKAVHRNMSDSQKAAAAVNFLPHFEKAALLRKKQGVPEPVPEGQKGESRNLAGGLFGVSGRYVSDAKALKAADPKLFREVFEGALPLTRAKRMVHSNGKKKALAAKAKNAPPVGDCQILAGDCLKRTDEIANNSARLIFIDPPYNIGIDYGQGKKADQRDRVEYLDFMIALFDEANRILTNDGSFWVMINDENAAEFKIELANRFDIRNWIKWYETFGNNCQDSFNRTSRHLFYCTRRRGGSRVFHHEAFTRPSARQTTYGDSRANPNGKLWDDVWVIPRLVENAAERVPGFPTQLPLALVEPIVLGCSDPGDLVVDFFTGSGTTAVAACTNGRKFKGFEINAKYAAAAEQRVRAAVAAKKGK